MRVEEEAAAVGGTQGAGEALARCDTGAPTSMVYDNPLRQRCRVEGAPAGVVASRESKMLSV